MMLVSGILQTDALASAQLCRPVAISALRGGCSSRPTAPQLSFALRNCRSGVRAVRGSAGGDAGADAKGALAKKPWGLLALLLTVYVHNQWSRNALQYSVNFAVSPSAETSREFVNVALGISKSEYAILASYAFILLYTVFSLVSGRVAGIVQTAVWRLPPAMRPHYSFSDKPTAQQCRHNIAAENAGPCLCSLVPGRRRTGKSVCAMILVPRADFALFPGQASLCEGFAGLFVCRLLQVAHSTHVRAFGIKSVVHECLHAAFSAGPSVSVCVCLRTLQGLAMAFTGPQCLSLLADRFPKQNVATATSIYTSGPVAAVLLIGGACTILACALPFHRHSRTRRVLCTAHLPVRPAVWHRCLYRIGTGFALHSAGAPSPRTCMHVRVRVGGEGGTVGAERG